MRKSLSMLICAMAIVWAVPEASALPGCEASEVPGCGGCICEECVCAMDAFCCNVMWDGICVNECLEQCGGCEKPVNCGDGNCLADEGENCLSCEEDCGCADGESCVDFVCCATECDGKECGLDGCGGVCGACQPGEFCTDEFACEPIPPCEVHAALHCDDTLELDTAAGINVFGEYDCVGWEENGPELGFSFDAEGEDLVVVTIEETGDADHDLFLLAGTCLPEQCIDYDGSSIQFTALPGNHYFLMVDGYGDDVGTLNLKVWCQSTCVPECDESNSCQDDGCFGLCPCADPGAVCFAGECCVAECEGKICGDDGCGGSCGECAGICDDGLVCMDGPGCVTSNTPTCAGCPCEACVCAMDAWCCNNSWDSLCVSECVDECGGCADLSNCGDGSCDAAVGETCSSCAEDCTCPNGEVCGTLNNGTACLPDMCAMGVPEIGCCQEGVLYACEEGETFALDCATLEENICGWYVGDVTYPPGYYCGPPDLITPGGDPSGEYQLDCTTCDPPCGDDEKCVGGECVECIPNCDGKNCGADGCGGECGACPEGLICQAGSCAVLGCEAMAEPGCGGCPCEACVCEMDPYCCESQWDNICVGECVDGCGGCPEPDPFCGDLSCNGDEDCGSCAKDCACAAGQLCDAGVCVDCVPNCDGLDCGDDGCGGSCGECGDEEECQDGLCIGPCLATCDGLDCGDDGCGGSCGECEDDEECVDGACESVAMCGNGVIDAGEECEVDGDCAVSAVCTDCACVDECLADCTDKACGDDGCGGSCGDCDDGATCIAGICKAEAGPDVVIGVDVVTGADVVGQADLQGADEAGEADVVGEKPKPSSSSCSAAGEGNFGGLLLMALAALLMLAWRRCVVA